MSDQTITVSNQPSWTHFLVYMTILLIGIVGGYEMGKVKGALIAIKANPPNTYNGPVALIDQSTKKAGYMFGIKPAKSWGIGICHD